MPEPRQSSSRAQIVADWLRTGRRPILVATEQQAAVRTALGDGWVDSGTRAATAPSVRRRGPKSPVPRNGSAMAGTTGNEAQRARKEAQWTSRKHPRRRGTAVTGRRPQRPSAAATAVAPAGRSTQEHLVETASDLPRVIAPVDVTWAMTLTARVERTSARGRLEAPSVDLHLDHAEDAEGPRIQGSRMDSRRRRRRSGRPSCDSVTVDRQRIAQPPPGLHRHLHSSQTAVLAVDLPRQYT